MINIIYKIFYFPFHVACPLVWPEYLEVEMFLISEDFFFNFGQFASMLPAEHP